MARVPIPKNPNRKTTIFRGKEVQVFDDVYPDASEDAPYGLKKDDTPYTKHHNNPDERILLSAWKMTENGKEHPVNLGAASQYSDELKAEIKEAFETSFMSYGQLSDEFDVPVGTIKTWVNKHAWKRRDDYSPVQGWWTKDSIKVHVQTLRAEQQEAMVALLDHVSAGVPLNRALKMDDVKRGKATFQNWKRTVEGFEDAFNQALQHAADSLFSDGIDIMDESLTESARCNVRDAKSISDQKLKAAAILSPKTYSEKARLDISNEDGSLVNPTMTSFNVIGVTEADVIKEKEIEQDN